MTILTPADGDLLDPEWGRQVTEAINEFLDPPTVIKPTSTSRASTVSITDDPALTLTLQPGDWEVTAVIIHNSAANAAGDMQARFSFPAGWDIRSNALFGLVDTIASGNSADLTAPAADTDTSSPTSTRNIGLSTAQTASLWKLMATVDDEGAITFQWAQLASNVNNSTVYLGSYLTARRVG